MRILISVLTLFLLTAPGLFAQSSIELTHEGTASFVQARGSIDTIIFVDLLGSSEPEAVLLDDSGLQVYALAFPMQLITEESFVGAYRKITVADMNDDDLLDVIAMHRPAQPAPGNVELVLFDNASGFAASDSAWLSQSDGSIYYFPSDAKRLLASVDFDGDGDMEVAVSFDNMVPDITLFGDRVDGKVFVFESIDSVVELDTHQSARSLDRIEIPGSGSALLANMRSVSCADIQVIEYLHLSSFVKQWLSVDSSIMLEELWYPAEGDHYCDQAGPLQKYTDRRSALHMQTAGQLTGDGATVEIVSTIDKKAACYDDGYDLDTTWSQLSLHRFTQGQPLQEMWTIDISGDDWHDFVYLPDFPGYFFAFVDGEFRQFRGGDGSLFQASGDVPEGDLHWAKPFADSLYRLIAVNGNNVSFYRPDIVTSANDQPQGSLPESFVLSAPYPNPFNPTVSFSISLPRQTELTIAIYNTLGQQVATVFEGTLPAGERPFIWDGSAHASGVYFIKAITDSATQTQKAVLVK